MLFFFQECLIFCDLFLRQHCAAMCCTENDQQKEWLYTQFSEKMSCCQGIGYSELGKNTVFNEHPVPHLRESNTRTIDLFKIISYIWYLK